MFESTTWLTRNPIGVHHDLGQRCCQRDTRIQINDCLIKAMRPILREVAFEHSSVNIEIYLPRGRGGYCVQAVIAPSPSRPGPHQGPGSRGRPGTGPQYSITVADHNRHSSRIGDQVPRERQGPPVYRRGIELGSPETQQRSEVVALLAVILMILILFSFGSLLILFLFGAI